MQKRTNVVWFIVALSVSVVIWAVVGMALAQKLSVPKPQDKLALGEPEVKQLLLLMDTDKNGKISKEEWMQFMEAEFDRLDKDKKGQLDAKELKQSKLQVSHPVNWGSKSLAGFASVYRDALFDPPGRFPTVSWGILVCRDICGLSNKLSSRRDSPLA